MRILIAEDEAVSRTALSMMLKKGGHEVVATDNGIDAWDTLNRPNAPEMIILDWMMPGLDGMEVLKNLRAKECKSPPYVLMVTAKNEKKDVVAALDAGADDFLTKPFDFGELRARIKVGQRMLDIRQKLAENIFRLESSLAQVRQLQGLIPICASCKKIRNDKGYWEEVEEYIADHSEAEFSHGICPECRNKLYPGLFDPDKGNH